MYLLSSNGNRVYDIALTLPQNRQLQNSCGMPASPHTPHCHPSVFWSTAGSFRPEFERFGRTPRHAAHCSASASLLSVQRGHSHSLSSGIDAEGGGASAEMGRVVDTGVRSRMCRGITRDPARVGGGVGVTGVTEPAGVATRECERGLGILGWASPAPCGTRFTRGRGMREEVDAVEERDEMDDDEEVRSGGGSSVLDELEVLPGDADEVDVDDDSEGGEGSSSSIIRISGSESESPVRSITSLRMLSFAAFSASRCATAPDAHASSSRALRSAACGRRVSEFHNETSF